MEWRARQAIARLPGWLRRVISIGALPEDSEALRLQKSVLVLSSLLMASLASVWIVTYAVLGLWLSAAIPFAYQLATAVSIAVFARTHRYVVFRRSQLTMSLLLPFVLQWSLGGFENASAVCLWGLTSPLGALLFSGPRRSVPWFAAFAGLVVLSALIDPALADDAPDIPQGVTITFFALNLVGVGFTAYALLQYFIHALARERAKSERLLLNVLPAPVAARLRERDEVIADDVPEVTVLFADLVGFTPLSERVPAPALVALLDRIFAEWDALAAAHRAEKIKTIGDAYMAAAGVPVPRPGHAEAIAALALEMGPAAARCGEEHGLDLRVRIGIDSGPVIAGVIGRSRFIYDLWGDTVNTASRMEAHAEPGTIQVTDRTRRLLEERFAFTPRGTIDVKGKGPMTTWVLTGYGPLKRSNPPGTP